MASTLSFGAYCPEGGDWYTCENSNSFVGCCVSSACGTTTGCPIEDVRTVSFNATWHGQFKDQVCDQAAGYGFYTCIGTPNDLPFLGCCKSKACPLGCPQEDLGNATLLEGNRDFLGTGPEFKPTNTPTSTPGGDSGGMSTGAIVGISVGIVGVVLIIIGALIFFYRRRRQAAKAQNPQGQQDPNTPNAGQNVEQFHSPGMVKAGYSPEMNHYNGQDRYSHTPAPAYYPPGSPEQQHYAKMQDSRSPHMSMVSPHMSMGSPPSAMFQGNWDSINPAAPKGGSNYMPGSQAAPAELDSGKDMAELDNTVPGSPK